MSAPIANEVDMLDLALVVDALGLLSKALARCAPPFLQADDEFGSLLSQVDAIVQQIGGRNGFDDSTSFVL